MATDLDPLEKWRLLLGDASDGALGSALSPGGAAIDAALSWLYGREADLGERDIRERSGGLGASSLDVPRWLDEVHRLFPREAIERLERDAIERYRIEEIVTNKEVLERVEPSAALLRAVLRTKHLMNPELLALARQLVARVVRELMEKLQRDVRTAFGGTLDRRRSTPVRSARNFDHRRTVRANLGRYSPEERRLYIEHPYFLARTRRFSEQWQVILLVDQSGSMLPSVIHAAVTAACLWGLPGIRTHLVAFDTSVVDLTADVTDPVELLMKVQLGGGTDIARAVQYATGLIEAPRRAIVAVISDFFEGGDPGDLVRRVRGLTAQGTNVLGLAALDDEAAPMFDRDLAGRLVQAGAHVAAMTPGELAGWIAEKVRG